MKHQYETLNDIPEPFQTAIRDSNEQLSLASQNLKQANEYYLQVIKDRLALLALIDQEI